MSIGQREALEKVARSQTAAHREVRRARVLLDAAAKGHRARATLDALVTQS